MRVGSHYLDSRGPAFFAAELTVLFVAFLAGAQFVSWIIGEPSLRSELLVKAALAVFALQAGFYLADLYDVRIALEDASRPQRLLKALGSATIFCGLALLLFRSSHSASGQAALAAGLGAACTTALVLRGALPEIGRRVPLRRRIYLVGHGRCAEALAREIHRDGQIEVVGAASRTLFGLAARARIARASEVVVAVDEKRSLDIRELLSCRLAGLPVLDAATFTEQVLKKIPIDFLRPSTLVFSDGFERPPWLLFARRMVSLAAAVGLFIVSLPLLLMVAIIIKLDSKGPVLYSQERVGMHGVPFHMYKFRTMAEDAEAGGVRWAARNDPRITRVGKILRRFRIDELPQLFNVLTGEMGLIGPRPERPQFVSQLRKEIPYYDLRHLVPPGITGWAQIRFPYAASIKEAREKLQFDLYYVKHLSVILDFVILFHTAKVVLFGRGAR